MPHLQSAVAGFGGAGCVPGFGCWCWGGTAWSWLFPNFSALIPVCAQLGMGGCGHGAVWGREMLQGDVGRRGCGEGVPACALSLACPAASNQLAPANFGMTFPLLDSPAASTALSPSQPSVPLTSAVPMMRGTQDQVIAETERQQFAPSLECDLGSLQLVRVPTASFCHSKHPPAKPPAPEPHRCPRWG